MAEIGPTLREARMRAHIDISEVEARTKIRAKYLRAIENEEWDLLPGSVYVRSFLKTYGDFLGLDSRLLVDEFKRRYERPVEHERPLGGMRREAAVPPRQGAVSGGRAANPGRAAARGTGGQTGGRGQRGANKGMPRGAAQPLRPPLLGPKTLIAIVIVAIIAVLFVIGISSPKKNGTSGNGSGITPARSTSTQTVSTKSSTDKTTTTTVSKPKVATLALTPTGDVWLCVTNTKGTVLVPGQTYAVGATVPKAHARSLLVSLGNGDVTANVNGKPYTISPSSHAIAFRVTPTGVKPLAAGPTCGV